MKDLSLNRSFKYGDGLFETLRVINTKVVFLNEHFERLSQGFDILSFDKPEDFSAEWLELEILNFIKEYNTANLSSWRVRITFWRNSPGFYYPENNTIAWAIETYPLIQSCFVLNEKGLEIGIYPDVKIAPDILSGIKNCSTLPYVMAAMHKKKMGWDDALILNSIGGITEASSSNIFILKNGQLVTPSVAEGPVQGVCRRKIIESAEELGLELTEGHITSEDLYDAEEIWLSNAVSGIRWVENLSGTELLFQSFFAQKMTEILNRKAKS
jgi:branched-subunit amino acid aminotransferase/4-amino-4-deoxychorismate lyase